MRVRLVGNGNNNILTPFGVPDYSDLQAGVSRSTGHLTFEITIQPEAVDKVSVKVTNASGLVLHRELPPAFRAAGTHQWTWDGFDQSGIFDTRALRDSFSFEFRSDLKGVPDVDSIKLHGERADANWVDASIDRNRKTVLVDLRIHLREGAIIGVGEAPPAEAQSTAAFKNSPKNSRLRENHVRRNSFIDLQNLVVDGMKRYWGGPVTLSGGTYQVSINPIRTKKAAMDDIAVAYNTNRGWLRSSNPGSVRGLYSLFGNFVPERIAYNVGWIQYGQGWFYRTPAQADEEFRETAAHEIGHEILSAYGGDGYSYGHRGSSSVVTQRTKSIAEGGVSYPTTGPIDIMKYHNGLRPMDYFLRASASEQGDAPEAVDLGL